MEEAPAPADSAAGPPWVPRVVRLLALAVVVLAPLRILAQGYLPLDDALRHAAKAVSGRDWSEILLLRPEITLDQHPGWHALLGALHRLGGLSQGDLVLFGVVALFALYSLGPLLLLRRPEAWLLAFSLLAVADPGLVERLMLGRPYLLASAIVPLACLLWERLDRPRAPGTLALFAALSALATWIHGSFFLLALPVLGVLAAREWRAGLRLAGALAIGVPLGALLTGHPLGHIEQALLHGYLALGSPRAATALVKEFQPFEGRPAAVAAFLALLAWRASRGGFRAPSRDPVVAMAAGCWALGFVASRFWIDWGAPALMTMAALDLQEALSRQVPERSWSRLAGSAGAALLALLVTTADLGGRWTDTSWKVFLSRENPEHAPWLPEPGGIAYSVDMHFFYTTFYRNPGAPWRYVLGFEPALMRPEDFVVFTEIRRTKGATESYLPWVARMRPEDRMYVRQPGNQPPPIPGLEWAQPAFAIWAGRTPRPAPGHP